MVGVVVCVAGELLQSKKALDGYAENKNAIVYIGIAYDETNRFEKEIKPYKTHPLADW